jgi:hypothetical protein
MKLKKLKQYLEEHTGCKVSSLQTTGTYWTFVLDFEKAKEKVELPDGCIATILITRTHLLGLIILIKDAQRFYAAKNQAERAELETLRANLARCMEVEPHAAKEFADQIKDINQKLAEL